MADIVYVYRSKVYLNLTNECPCSCTFCIRKNGDSIGDADMMWHKTTPTLDEVIAAVDSFDFTKYDEVIVCGYGEPTCTFDVLTATCRHLKEKFGIRIRINTNGLGNLVNKRDVVKEFCENIDSVSISLNAPDAEKYAALTNPKFGLQSFDAMLSFAKECKEYLDDVHFSVVDVISEEDIAACRKLADSIGIPLRVREYEH
ncbi:MAG: TIGR04100 family radical SAM protein [Oscillospiraceae bacterium]|nr:TIGR04100 family radical SAM protein [Oscillospiraceae bacterium]